VTVIPLRSPPRPADRAYVVLLALLVGAQVAVGGLVAPALFAVVPDRTLAGTVAGEIFTRLGWVSLAVLPVLWLLQWNQSVAAGTRASRWWRLPLPLMLVLTAVGHLGLRPWIAAVRSEVQARGGFEICPPALKAQFGILHGASSLVFLAVAVLGISLLLRLRVR
jgi:hypothetical protein